MHRFVLLAFICLLYLTGRAQNISGKKYMLQVAPPAAAGFSAERLARIDSVVQFYIRQHWIAGAAALIVRHGKIVYYKGIGYDDVDKKSPLPRDAIFRIASQSKAITSAAVMMLYEEGKLLLDDPVSKYIPEFKNARVLDHFNESDSSYTTVPAKREPTIRDLLTHTSGIGYAVIGSKEANAIYAKAGIPSGIGALPGMQLAEKMRRLAQLPLMHQPGEKWTYGLNTDMLGYLVELLSGLSLDEFFRQRIFEPLGMKDTYFYLPKEKYRRLATLYTEDAHHQLVKAPAEHNGILSDYPKEVGGTYYSGGAGLSSTLYDYAVFLQMLLNGGEYKGKRILSRNGVRMMTMNQIGDLSLGSNKFGLGFEMTTEKGSARLPMAVGSFAWGGYFSTAYWADPREELVALIMTQLNPNSHGELFDKYKVLVYQALND